MTATPFYQSGEVASPEVNATVNFPAGSLTCTRGTLAVMFTDAAFLSSCMVESNQRQRKEYKRTDYIGAPAKTVAASSWEEIRYPSQTKSQSAGGEPIQLKVNGEWWTARLSGSHYAFHTFLCGARNSLYGPVSWRSARGTLYGPVSNETVTGG